MNTRLGSPNKVNIYPPHVAISTLIIIDLYMCSFANNLFIKVYNALLQSI